MNNFSLFVILFIFFNEINLVPKIFETDFLFSQEVSVRF